MPPSQNEKLVEIGKKVLANYSHPDSWVDGDYSRPGCKMLKVEEIRVGHPPLVNQFDSDINAKAILAWAASVGIEAQLTLSREPNKAPYVVVPGEYFTTDVLPHLQALKKPGRTEQ